MQRTALFGSILCLAAGSSASWAWGVPPPSRYVDSRAVFLSFATAAGSKVDEVELWVSTDDGENWRSARVDRVADNTVRFDAIGDGKYCFYMVLCSGGQRSAELPSSQTTPHAVVVVDTASPTMQIHGVRPRLSPEGERIVRIKLSLLEENIGQSGVRLFYRETGGEEWKDGGNVHCVGGVIDWNVPPDASPAVDLRLSATDLAGNQATEEIRGIPTLGRTPASQPTVESSEPARKAARSHSEIPGESVTHADSPVTPTPAVPTSRPAIKARRQAALLRRKAARFLAEGRFALAGSRLQEALALVPGDPDIQVELGRVFSRTDQLPEAAHRFQLALENAPDHPGALEGLALVEVKQKRYSQARAHLKRLLRIEPETAKHWLHYGDIEHMLGNDADARAAWRKTLKLAPADAAVREKSRKRLELFGARADSHPRGLPPVAKSP